MKPSKQKHETGRPVPVSGPEGERILGSGEGAVKELKLAHTLAHKIVRLVTREPIAPGVGLGSEATMADRFGVARPTLREALRMLEMMGFVHMKRGPGGGPIVSPPERHNFGEVAALYYAMAGATYRDLLDARLALEPVSVRLVAERGDGDDLAAIRQHLDLAARLDPNGEPEFRQIGHDFHYMLASMSGNPIMDVLVRSCQDVFASRVQWAPYTARVRKEIVGTHAEIGEAILVGDVDQAEALMRQHMVQFIARTSRRYTGLMDEPISWQ